MIRPGIDHIALTVPDLGQQVDRLTATFGMAIESRTDDVDDAYAQLVAAGMETARAPHRP